MIRGACAICSCWNTSCNPSTLLWTLDFDHSLSSNLQHGHCTICSALLSWQESTRHSGPLSTRVSCTTLYFSTDFTSSFHVWNVPIWRSFAWHQRPGFAMAFAGFVLDHIELGPEREGCLHTGSIIFQYCYLFYLLEDNSCPFNQWFITNNHKQPTVLAILGC